MGGGLLTPEERLRQVDRAVEEVKQSFVEAVEELASSDAVASPFEDRLGEIAARLRELPGKLEPSVFERDQIHELHAALHEIRDLMADLERVEDRLDILNELLLRIEVIRHIVRDAIDEHVAGIGDDAGHVVTQIGQWLPAVPQREIARLAGVDRRTVARWTAKSGPPQRRLQLVAQLVAVLRHSWTGEGVVAWFDRSNHDLGDRKPISLLDDATRERDLLMAARATRSQDGT
jgi:transcriptional regulator with XRE-family HTH domain